MWGGHAASAARAAYSEIGRVLQDQGLTIVHERLFGSISVKSAVLAARDAAFRGRNLPANGPITYVQGHPPWGEGLAGIIIRAVSPRYPQDRVWTIRDQGQPVGRGWRQGDATFLVLQNLQGLIPNGNGANGPAQQAQRMIQRAAQDSSRARGPHTVMWRAPGSTSRTSWPGTRSSTRPAVRYTGNLASCLIYGGDSRRLPASTAIRGEVSLGAAGALDLLAVVGPPDSRPLVRQLRSPAQPEALTYGSAFSRGALIRHPDVSLIQVSGTAAIDAQGRSLHPGDVQAQIDCTFDKIAALIGQEGAALADIAAACVFVKRPEDALIYQDRAAARGLEHLPAVVMVADVCREELLCEIDAEVAFDPLSRSL